MSAHETQGPRVEGVIQEVLPGQVFRVRLLTGEVLTAHPAEELRIRSVRLVPGQRVTLDVPPWDWSRGRIIAPAAPGR